MRMADRLLHAQMSLAEGCSYLFRIEDGGKDGKRKHVLVTNPDEIQAYFDGDDDSRQGYHYVTTDKPNNEALKDLWDRVFGKPSQALEVTGKDGGPVSTVVQHVHEPG